jgi:predicted transcriptional regulator
MNAPPIKIRVQTEEEERREFIRSVHDAQRRLRAGERVRAEHVLVFRTLEDLRSFLTPERIRLLRIIRREKPASVYRLAKIAGRDRKAVTTDLGVLTNLGLVRMEKSKGPGRARSIAHVPYSRLDISVEV